MFLRVGYDCMEGMMSISGYVPGDRHKIAVNWPIGASSYPHKIFSAKL